MIGETEKMITNACEEVRRISHDMMPDALVNLGLSEAIKDLAFQIEYEHGLNTLIDVPEIDLEKIKSINIYRIIQEFCNNSIKYAQASQLTIHIKENPASLKIHLADDGRGFDLAKAMTGPGIGIKSIESRVKFLNGFVDIEAENGTTYNILIPTE